MAQAPAGVELAALELFWREHLAEPAGPLRAELLAGGRSNLTYAISDGATTWVLRRPPLGHVLPTAHDMAREYRVLNALARTDVPVPRPLALSTDETVLGSPFYVMTWVAGNVVRDQAQAAALTTDEARRCSRALVDVLARIHGLDYERIGLGGFGRPQGYLARQIERWWQQWERSATRPLPAIDELVARLRAACGPESDATVVHGDYRLDNTILAADDPARILAVVDWEMSTLGDPLADLGLALVYWGELAPRVLGHEQPVTANAGFFSADELADAYASASGRDLARLDFYVVLGYFKLAVIAEGIRARFLMGKTLGEGFEHVGENVPLLVDAALERASRSRLPGLRGPP